MKGLLRKEPQAEREGEPAREAPEPPDELLVRRARDGELEAFDALVRRYQRRVYGTIYHMTANREDADDIAQTVFIKAFRNLKRFRGQASFYSWIHRIAVNETINFLKKRGRRRQVSLDNMDAQVERDPDYVALVSHRTPRRDAHLSELHRRLNEAMLKLSPVHRAVVTLHDIQGLSHEEISRIMKCRVGTVRSRLFYARQQLQAYLSEYLDRQ